VALSYPLVFHRLIAILNLKIENSVTRTPETMKNNHAFPIFFVNQFCVDISGFSNQKLKVDLLIHCGFL
jgi:hypothetical protein